MQREESSSDKHDDEEDRDSRTTTTTPTNTAGTISRGSCSTLEAIVHELWRPGINLRELQGDVERRLGSASAGHDNQTTTSSLKRRIKLAISAIPYQQQQHTPQQSSSSSETRIPFDKQEFVALKLKERQRLRDLRKFKEADRITRGIEALGVVIDDTRKTWVVASTSSVTIRPLDELLDNSQTKRKAAEVEAGSETTGPRNDNTGGKTAHRCTMCHRAFPSRNHVFRHLRDPGSGCGTSIFVSDQSLPKAPSIQKKELRQRQNNALRRRKTGTTAVHGQHALWMGDLPLEWTRHGGNHKRLRALLRAHVPRSVPQPWIQRVQRKAYRSKQAHSKEQLQQQRANDTDNTDNDNNDGSAVPTIMIAGASVSASLTTTTVGRYLGYAIVTFRDAQECEVVRQALDGSNVSVENVFSEQEMEATGPLPSFQLKVRPVDKPAKKATVPLSVDAVVTQDPPLRDQLKPLTVDELHGLVSSCQSNLNNATDVEKEDDDFPSEHELALEYATAKLSNRPRTESFHEGRAVPDTVKERLLSILESLRWSVPNHRQGLTAERYLVLQTNVSNDRFYSDLRDACRTLMDWADPNYYYSGIAVTKNFVSSPHIDDRDQTFQYAISLGTFDSGGELCLSKKNSYSGSSIHIVNTHNRIARVDGRHVHWVRPWNGRGGDRYSLIFYDTSDRNPTPIMQECVDVNWIGP